MLISSEDSIIAILDSIQNGQPTLYKQMILSRLKTISIELKAIIS